MPAPPSDTNKEWFLMRRLSLLMGLLSLGLLLCRGASPAAAEGHPSDRRAQWVARYGGPFGNPDYAADIVAAPDGSAVYVTGAGATGNNSWSDYATLAYDAHTGEREWLARYDGPIAEDDSALAMAVSPDGSRVFVTGHSAFAG